MNNVTIKVTSLHLGNWLILTHLLIMHSLTDTHWLTLTYSHLSPCTDTCSLIHSCTHPPSCSFIHLLTQDQHTCLKFLLLSLEHTCLGLCSPSKFLVTSVTFVITLCAEYMLWTMLQKSWFTHAHMHACLHAQMQPTNLLPTNAPNLAYTNPCMHSCIAGKPLHVLRSKISLFFSCDKAVVNFAC